MRKKQRAEIRERADARKQYAREQVRVAEEKKAGLLEAARNVLHTRDILWEDRHIARLPEGPRRLLRGLLDGPRCGRKLVHGAPRDALVRLGEVPPKARGGTRCFAASAST
jgi:hypothetical protein